MEFSKPKRKKLEFCIQEKIKKRGSGLRIITNHIVEDMKDKLKMANQKERVNSLCEMVQNMSENIKMELGTDRGSSSSLEVKNGKVNLEMIHRGT